MTVLIRSIDRSWAKAVVLLAASILLTSAQDKDAPPPIVVGTDPEQLVKEYAIKAERYLSYRSPQKRATLKRELAVSRKKSDQELDPVSILTDGWVVNERNDADRIRLFFHIFSNKASPRENVDRSSPESAFFQPIGVIATPGTQKGDEIRSEGTGFLIGPCRAITATHVLPDPDGSIGVDGKANGPTIFQLGSSPKAEFLGNTKIDKVLDIGIDNEERMYDKAVVQLRTCVGRYFGWYDIFDWSRIDDNHEYEAMRAGYPSDRKHGTLTKQRCFAKFLSIKRGDYHRAFVADNCDHINGQSGGPLFVKQDGLWKVAGALSGGDRFLVLNSGARVGRANSNALNGSVYQPDAGAPSNETNPLAQMVRDGMLTSPSFKPPQR